MSSHAPLLIWSVAALTTAGVLFRPFRLPEAFWAAAGALLLCVTGLMALPTRWRRCCAATTCTCFSRA